MIKNIIFDFGAVLIPLDEHKTWESFRKLGALDSLKDQKKLFHKYETGGIETADFLKKLQPHFFRKKIFPGDLAKAWNAMLYTALPGEIIDSLKKWKRDYRLFLLSNTNDLHISEIKSVAGPYDYGMFVQQFEKVYYSYEIGKRKPSPDIFKMVLEDNDLEAEETFYVDDGKKNTSTAKKLGIHTWHFDPLEDSIHDLDKVLSAHHS
ncbi:MAG TPA: haloacid dehalogenase [Cryomorphaceae bacterium]|nr:haloacid dehalogenase [Owenweeksia sp.]MBG00226.1 haloacid dehalogenase [Owenweeksia sp.]HAD97574.1 haloacid dehalogenase [Cryomorphaceae bacterium]HBF19075.1 haloacid dehalogenase [Cryomorphaceae bacterium]HCQ14767.1 haloacid dehalogenase [Cryomorphaceae bacterium]|tara:strand:- start:1439 stop:2059 length:621 start_codon:yes stop_codon:yes gene_type:complete